MVDVTSRSFATRLSAVLTADTSTAHMKNVHTNIDHYTLEGETIITTITDTVLQHNCYVVSPYALIISYAKVEVHKVPTRLLRFILRGAMEVFSFVLYQAKIDTIQILNNYLLSTNFYSTAWRTFSSAVLVQLATKRYPHHALALRSLNQTQNKECIAELSRAKWLPVVTRQVYIFRGLDRTRRDIKRDLALLKSPRFVFVEPNTETLDDFIAAEQLYEQLYLKKYSEENIQYRAVYMQKLSTEGLLHLRLLRDTERNRYVGVVGIVGDEETLTAPIVGYDLECPSSDALYRRCIIYILQYADTRQTLLNLSSGAPDFKRNRGAVPEIEYMFVYVQHLSFFRRAVWYGLSKISLWVYLPVLQKYKL